eukprot:15557-Pyramimonas_sp.AAC.1
MAHAWPQVRGHGASRCGLRIVLHHVLLRGHTREFQVLCRACADGGAQGHSDDPGRWLVATQIPG